jgi:hypothetical protein
MIVEKTVFPVEPLEPLPGHVRGNARPPVNHEHGSACPVLEVLEQDVLLHLPETPGHSLLRRSRHEKSVTGTRASGGGPPQNARLIKRARRSRGAEDKRSSH